MAAAFSQMPFQFVGKIISSIAMPAFSEMQTDKARINTTIMEVTAMITSLGFPLLLYAILYGRDLLLLIYGPQYARPFDHWGTLCCQ
jgi:O-antigen/teichoic acid export membrane protein